VTVTLLLEPKGIAGLSLVSEVVKVSVPGFGLLELTVKLTLPFESVVAVALSAVGKLPFQAAQKVIPQEGGYLNQLLPRVFQAGGQVSSQ